MSRCAERLRGLGPCDLLTIAEAVRVLGIREREGRALLVRRGLVRHYAGRPRVLVGDLVAATDESITTEDSVASLLLPRPSSDL